MNSTRWLFSCLISVALTVSGCGDDSGDDGATAGSSSTTAGSGTTTTTSTTSAGSSSGSSTTAMGTGSTGMMGMCDGIPNAIVTDIDETLTTADAEWLMQVTDGNYDPLERDGAAEMVQQYADLGYHILYLTARSEMTVVAVTKESAQQATERWLMEHGFPMGPRTEVQLAPTLVIGPAAQMYKAQALADRQAMGLTFDYAYGNADSDIGAYEDAMIDKATTFIIGDEAGMGGTVPVNEPDWLTHTMDHLPMVPMVCDPG